MHLTTCEFQYSNKQMQLLSPTDATEDIYVAACKIFKKLWDKGRRSGVTLRIDVEHEKTIYEWKKISAK